MNDCFLPLIAIPNDTNENDIVLILSNGDKVSASEAMKKYPLLKSLVQKNLKLMADEPSATIFKPQVWIVTFENCNYVSISFYCSKDNFQRETSASLVFTEGQAEMFSNWLSTAELPESLKSLRKDMRKIVNEFSFWNYVSSSSENQDVKKKTSFVIAFVIMLIALAMISLIKSPKERSENSVSTKKSEQETNR